MSLLEGGEQRCIKSDQQQQQQQSTCLDQAVQISLSCKPSVTVCWSGSNSVLLNCRFSRCLRGKCLLAFLALLCCRWSFTVLPLELHLASITVLWLKCYCVTVGASPCYYWSFITIRLGLQHVTILASPCYYWSFIVLDGSSPCYYWNLTMLLLELHRVTFGASPCYYWSFTVLDWSFIVLLLELHRVTIAALPCYHWSFTVLRSKLHRVTYSCSFTVLPYSWITVLHTVATSPCYHTVLASPYYMQLQLHRVATLEHQSSPPHLPHLHQGLTSVS